ncbi:sensor histidine kinase [Roseivirga sp. BDSF3-8]|uniref:sensor histidine kinase n=1 Tax=Roseivirga sp. BDSF3-8 TaxID=3241598 RepID=UPI0035319764
MKRDRRANGYGTALLLVAMVVFLVMMEEHEPLFSITFAAYMFLLLFWLVSKYMELVRLKNEKRKTELQHLQSQVSPHFFFNTLNNLYGLIGKDQDKARKMVLQLSDMMRYSIYEGQKEWVTLEEELAYLQGYITLQQSRYHRQVLVDLEADVGHPQLKVKPLLFIILVENAFKHGVENMQKGAYVTIGVQTDDKGVDFRVENNTEPDTTTTSGGLGLENLKRRLELSYPGRHTLKTEASPEIFQAYLRLEL